MSQCNYQTVLSAHLQLLLRLLTLQHSVKTREGAAMKKAMIDMMSIFKRLCANEPRKKS